MKDPCADYVRQVGRELELPRRRKRILLAGLRQELEERFPGEVSPDMLLAEAGVPGETARFLMESVQPEEQERHRAGKRRRILCAVAALAALLALAVGAMLYLDATEIKRAEIAITQDSVSIDYSSYSDGFDSVAP